MTPNQQLVQRYHDGEANRVQQMAIEGLLAHDPALAQQSQALENLNQQLMAQAAGHQQRDVESLVAQVMERAPAETPKAHAAINLGHVLVGGFAIAMVAMAMVLADMCRLWLPVEGIAAACAIIGLALVVAARPLAQLENSLIGSLFSKRMVVGDGEVLVCRALGVALLVGAAHIIGLWI